MSLRGWLNMYESRGFDNCWDLTKWLNQNKIKKENVVSITEDPTSKYGRFTLFYFTPQEPSVQI